MAALLVAHGRPGFYLRVLEEGEVERVGGDRPMQVDVRVVVATHRNLEALVKQLGHLLADPAARELSDTASEHVVEQLGGALERTLTALEPYLLQLRLEMGAANA